MRCRERSSRFVETRPSTGRTSTIRSAAWPSRATRRDSEPSCSRAANQRSRSALASSSATRTRRAMLYRSQCYQRRPAPRDGVPRHGRASLASSRLGRSRRSPRRIYGKPTRRARQRSPARLDARRMDCGARWDRTTSVTRPKVSASSLHPYRYGYPKNTRPSRVRVLAFSGCSMKPLVFFAASGLDPTIATDHDHGFDSNVAFALAGSASRAPCTWGHYTCSVQ